MVGARVRSVSCSGGTGVLCLYEAEWTVLVVKLSSAVCLLQGHAIFSTCIYFHVELNAYH